ADGDASVLVQAAGHVAENAKFDAAATEETPPMVARLVATAESRGFVRFSDGRAAGETKVHFWLEQGRTGWTLDWWPDKDTGAFWVQVPAGLDVRAKASAVAEGCEWEGEAVFVGGAADVVVTLARGKAVESPT